MGLEERTGLLAEVDCAECVQGGFGGEVVEQIVDKQVGPQPEVNRGIGVLQFEENRTLDEHSDSEHLPRKVVHRVWHDESWVTLNDISGLALHHQIGQSSLRLFSLLPML
jgi:hypothetical protein